MKPHLTATGCHLPYGITQCYLSPYTSEHTEETRQLVVPITGTEYGDRSFAVQGPRVLNSLPIELRDPDFTDCIQIQTENLSV